MTTQTMAEEKEFKPLYSAGAIAASDSSEFRFYVDEFKGYKYASIRTFIKRDDYAGPTKAGLTMNQQVLDTVIEKLAPLPEKPEHTDDFEIARIQKKSGIELVVRITIYRDTTGLDFREWVDDGVYKGWSKKGVRIGYEELPKIREYLKALSEFLKKQK